MYFLTNLFVAVQLFSYYHVSFRFLPESIRWLVTKSKVTQAEYHIRRIASFNHASIPDELDLFVSQKYTKEFSFHDLFRTPNMRKRTLLMGYIWSVLARKFLLQIYF